MCHNMLPLFPLLLSKKPHDFGYARRKIYVCNSKSKKFRKIWRQPKAWVSGFLFPLFPSVAWLQQGLVPAVGCPSAKRSLVEPVGGSSSNAGGSLSSCQGPVKPLQRTPPPPLINGFRGLLQLRLVRRSASQALSGGHRLSLQRFEWLGALNQAAIC